ncbi:acyl-CoA dehydrogenase [Zhouia amylolytica AD3]|uniref:Cyclohex-1-ene-1-carbonyl-CoA dehydrogenase n=1 Tax=Zhouia amylolytica AD3 TaxID=1286632 RepID=W2UT22_9FLAO|nr:acyl-CoA dehydrogenase [Zhouia amylolytica AD3]
MGELGFMGMMVAPEYGGSGLDTVSYVLAMEEISKIDASASVVMSVNNSLVCWGLEKYGTEEQKQKYLPRLASGEILGAFCLSEPEAGSDATSQRTTAIDQGDHYILNGTKNWITNGGTADVYLVIAQTYPEKGHHGINALIVEKGMPGFEVGLKENKLGIRGSDTHSLMFTDVKVPKENRIGEDGFGFKFAMKTLSGGRIGIASQALGIASGAYELAKKYSKERKAFGTEICNHQAIAFKLADMYTEIEAARLLIMKAARDKDNDDNYDLSSAAAKVYASKVAMDVTVEAVQIHGGYGFVKEYHVERLMRVGQELPDSTMEMEIMAGSVKMDFGVKSFNKKVVAEETINVPAGTYDCMVVTEHTETKMMITKKTTSKLWYAKGVGLVKQEEYNKKGDLVGLTVLTNFKD